MYTKFKYGQAIVVRKGPFDHLGLKTSLGMVIDASPETGGVTERSFQEFSGGKPVRSADIEPAFSPTETVARARAKIGKPYNPFTANCEHLVRWATEGSARSKQVKAGLTLAAGVGLFWLFTRE